VGEHVLGGQPEEVQQQQVPQPQPLLQEVVVVGQLVLVVEQFLAQQAEVQVQEHFLQLVEAEVLPQEVEQVLQEQVLLVQVLLVGLQQFLL
jgi:hypothetical protein